MPRIGLAGPTYQSRSPNVSADFTMNLYPEAVETGRGKADFVLYGTPGLSVFSAGTAGAGRIRGSLETNERVFIVEDATLWEVLGDGSRTNRGTVTDDMLPVSMATSPSQLLVASAGTAYTLDLTVPAGILQSIAPGTLSNVGQVAHIDGYFIASIKDSRTFRISTIFDANSWPGLQVVTVSVFSDNVVSIIGDHRILWVMGRTKSVAYYDSGSTQIFDVIPGSHIEFGGIAGFSPVNLNNTVYWLVRDSKGSAMAVYADGFTPRRVSTHGIGQAWGDYTTLNDAISWAYQDSGHAFWVIYFPSADKTWVYDATANMWHERGFLSLGQFQAHLGRTHVYAFGKHLVGSRNSGDLYDMSLAYLDDAGTNKRWVRRASHISQENRWLIHHELVLDLEAGVGPIPPLEDGAGNPRAPQVNLRWSDDGGHTWSNYHAVGVGQAGEYKARARWSRLGQSRDRVYEVSGDDPVNWALIEAYLQVSMGSGA